MQFTVAAALLLASASTAVANCVKVNNWGKAPAYWAYSVNMGADVPLPAIPAGQIGQYCFPTGQASTSIKVGRTPDRASPLQLEVKPNADKYWYNLSFLDGNSFLNGNIKVTPTGPGILNAAGLNCVQLKCTPGGACPAYFNKANNDADAPVAVKSCAPNMGDLWLDLDQPANKFNSREVEKFF